MPYQERGMQKQPERPGCSCYLDDPLHGLDLPLPEVVMKRGSRCDAAEARRELCREGGEVRGEKGRWDAELPANACVLEDDAVQPLCVKTASEAGTELDGCPSHGL